MQVVKSILEELNYNVFFSLLNASNYEVPQSRERIYIVAFKKTDMLKFRNFGKKSLTELEELVDGKNLYFGFDTSKYNLDKTD